MNASSEIRDDYRLPDADLLSPATLAFIPRLPIFLRESHRRTGRLMALKRLRDGLPAWETAEEAKAPDGQPERLSEAEARGFASRDKEKQATASDPFLLQSPKRMAAAVHEDDDTPADPTWLRYHLALSPELSRLPFLPAARKQIPRKHWRAALAGLLYRPRSRVKNAAGFVARAAEELACGNGRDSRLSKWFTVQPGWPVRLAEAADATARLPGWEPKSWGPQTYR